MTTMPLHTTTVLDGAAIAAEQRALLAELTLERFGELRCSGSMAPYSKEAAVVRHLRKAATAAREHAEAERDRCARTIARGAV